MIDGCIVEIVVELDCDGLWGVMGVWLVVGLVVWKMGCLLGNVYMIVMVVWWLLEFLCCVWGMWEGWLLLD